MKKPILLTKDIAALCILGLKEKKAYIEDLVGHSSFISATENMDAKFEKVEGLYKELKYESNMTEDEVILYQSNAATIALAGADIMNNGGPEKVKEDVAKDLEEINKMIKLGLSALEEIDKKVTSLGLVESLIKTFDEHANEGKSFHEHLEENPEVVPKEMRDIISSPAKLKAKIQIAEIQMNDVIESVNKLAADRAARSIVLDILKVYEGKKQEFDLADFLSAFEKFIKDSKMPTDGALVDAMNTVKRNLS